MKIQCPCGAKYEIDVTPGMQPVQFICQNCGQDFSAFVNELIRRELGEQNHVVAKTLPAATQSPIAAPAPSAPPAGSRLRISTSSMTAAQSPSETPAAAICQKHREPAPEQCFVCKKPICPKCMELFGYFCSPFCKGKAEAQKLDVPVFAGQTFVKEAQYWRKLGTIGAVIGIFLVLFFGVWTWYAWYAAVPHVFLSVKFDNRSFSGTSFATNGQMVFLHGGTLARYSLKTKKPAWSLELVTKQQVDDILKQEDEEDAKERAMLGRPEYSHVELPSVREENARAALERELSLYVSGQNIWTTKPGEERIDAHTNFLQDTLLTRYDRDTGKVTQQVTFTTTNSAGEFEQRGDELVMLRRTEDGGQFLTHFSLADGQVRTDEIPGVGRPTAANINNLARAGGSAKDDSGGLPLSPYDKAKPLDPQKVAEQAQNLTPAGRIALPAVIANAEHQQQIQNELNDGDTRGGKKSSTAQTETNDFQLVPDGDGFLEFAARLAKENFVEREAMKAPPAKSTIDSGNVNMGNEMQAVNEQLNEMQRSAGGDTVTEDQSVYHVIIRKPGSASDDWSGDVVGTPALFPLKTINVLTAGKSVTVFDKSDKKLWQAQLTYEVSGGGFGYDQSPYGQGPCVEHGDTLYIFDQAVLTAFDLSSGNVRWRLPSIGIVGLFFDDQGMMYVNTTSGNPNDIKYARQIDVTKKTENVLLKVDPKTGRTLWSTNPQGVVCYLSGKFIYACYSFDPGEADDQSGENVVAMMNPAFLRITRINPKNGSIIWEHTEARAPIDLQFDRNSIRLIFKKEVEVLHYLAL